MKTCKYCGKEMPVQFHRGGNAFCNETCASLFDHADIVIIKPTRPPRHVQQHLPFTDGTTLFGDSDHDH